MIKKEMARRPNRCFNDGDSKHAIKNKGGIHLIIIYCCSFLPKETKKKKKKKKKKHVAVHTARSTS
jgi:hypothetical protein